jgi:manganese efflux pump family protein
MAARPRSIPLSLPYLLLIALSLSMDAFAVSTACGVQIGMVKYGLVLRVAIAFGVFQFIMPVIGWFAGSTFAGWVLAVDHWIAFGLLGIIGARMIWESFRADTTPGKDPTRGWNLLVLAVATSIDALAVGLSFAFLKTSIWFPAMVIGIVAAVLSAIGALFGCRLGHRFGVWAERAGGLVLIGIGTRILIQHLT